MLRFAIQLTSITCEFTVFISGRSTLLSIVYGIASEIPLMNPMTSVMYIRPNLPDQQLQNVPMAVWLKWKKTIFRVQLSPLKVEIQLRVKYLSSQYVGTCDHILRKIAASFFMAGGLTDKIIRIRTNWESLSPARVHQLNPRFLFRPSNDDTNCSLDFPIFLQFIHRKYVICSLHIQIK